jgi:hypothetical protein
LSAALSSAEAALRRFVSALFFVGALGTAAELLLLGHTESLTQLVPLALLTAGCVAVAASLRHPARTRLLAIQGLMVLFLVSGIVGVLLHLRSNWELEREMAPEAAALTLVWDAVAGGTPTLAPGTMILLGGLGFAYTYRHPAGLGSARSAHGN